MRHLLSILVAGAVLGAPGVATAQPATDYPSRPIKLVVGFAPGGATDVVARMVTGALSEQLGQAVVVENVPGASGLLGWRNVAAANPDGYTLLMAENAMPIRASFKDMQPPFDPVAQLDGIAGVAHSPLVLCVANAVPANNVKELIAYAHSSGKKLNYASSGQTSVAQLVWEVVKDATKIDAVNVPYRGGGPAMADLVAGQVDFIMASSQVAKPFVEAKKIKARHHRHAALSGSARCADAGRSRHQARRRRPSVLVRRVRAQGLAGQRKGEDRKSGRTHIGVAHGS